LFRNILAVPPFRKIYYSTYLYAVIIPACWPHDMTMYLGFLSICF